MGANRVSALIASCLLAWPAAAAVLERSSTPMPPSEPAGSPPTAHVTIASFRLTDNSDNDGIGDPRETVNLFLTLRNGSGSDLTGIVVQIASNDAIVGCITTPVISFGSLSAGEVRESAVPLTFHVADVNRASVADELSATLEVTVTGDGFQAPPQEVTVDLDLDLSLIGPLTPTTFTEGFEFGLGQFSRMSLDPGLGGPNANSEGYRCQYNDPDFANSNSYGNTYCYLSSAADDWHAHGTGSTDGGRGYLGSASLHWGMHVPPGPSADTTRLAQLDAIRTTNPVNLGWNGVTSELSFKHQIGIMNCDPDGPIVNCVEGLTIDRAVVQVQPAASSGGAPIGPWTTIRPYQNLYDAQVEDIFPNCLFDPTDDGNDEDDYFDPNDPARRLGPSSTCAPEFTFSRQGAIFYTDTFDPADIHRASDGPGLQGSLGPGTWVETKFSLARWRGRRIRVRFLVSTPQVNDLVSWRDFLGGGTTEADDGWYIDDVRVTNTVAVAATVTVDTVDRSALPSATWYADADQDGFGNPSGHLLVCDGSTPTGYVLDNTDCNDAAPAIHPGISDALCNGVDDNCSGAADEGYVPQSTSCGVGACARSGSTSCVAGVVHDSCTPGPPAPNDATCNNVDEDCSGAADEDYVSIPDRWLAMNPTGAPFARSHHTMVATTAGRFLVWGGVDAGGSVTQTGAIYDAANNVWAPTSLGTGVPTPRMDHRAVWTASQDMVVFGGSLNDGATYLSTGSKWNSGGWTALPSFQAPSVRALHVQVATTGADVIVWGGRSQFTQTNTGARLFNGTNWSPTSTVNAPSARFNATGVWTGSLLIVWGGEALGSPFNTVFNTGAMYSPTSDAWVPMSTVGAPSARTRHTALWINGKMIVWGGFNGNATYFNDGAAFDPVTNSWSPITSAGAPSARADHVAVWSGSKMIVWGGFNGTTLATGGRYDVASNTWTPMVQPGPAGTRYGAAIWFPGLGPLPSLMAAFGGETSPGVYAGPTGFYQTDSSCGIGPCSRQGGTICTNGTVGYGCIPGQPQPESCNAVDDDCDGTVDNHVGGNPGITCLMEGKGGGLLVSSTLSWTAFPGATSYDVVRGLLPSLRSSGGNYTASVDSCLANDTAALSTTDPNDPPAGSGYWHLLRANLSGGPATYDENSPRQVGLRDAEIAAAAAACP